MFCPSNPPQDGCKQDAINLFLGDFQPGSALQQKQQVHAVSASLQSSYLATLFALGGGVAWVIRSIFHQQVWLSAVAGVVAMIFLFTRGSSLIDRPSLCAGAHKEW